MGSGSRLAVAVFHEVVKASGLNLDLQILLPKHHSAILEGYREADSYLHRV